MKYNMLHDAETLTSVRRQQEVEGEGRQEIKKMLF